MNKPGTSLVIFVLSITTTVPYLLELAEGLACSDKRFRSNPALVKAFNKTLAKLKAAERFIDLNQIGSLHLKTLQGEEGLWAVRVNDQYRLHFTVEPPGADPMEVTGLVLMELSNHYA